MEYRRVYVKGGTYFFTLVTYNRRLLFSFPDVFATFNNAILYTQDRMPFDLIAIVILPDHIYLIITLPEDSYDFSTRLRLIKSHFTRHRSDGQIQSESSSRINKGERDVWQRRFWEHLIRDDLDLTRHIEYIHYNPVKHGFVQSPSEWEYSSFKKYVQDGLYPADWGGGGKVWAGETWME